VQKTALLAAYSCIGQQVSVTGLVNPFGFDAVQWKIWVVTGWKMSSVTLVNVSVGFTPVQLGFGHPAAAPLTVGAAVRVAGLVVKVRFPFLIAPAGRAVRETSNPTSPSSRRLGAADERFPAIRPGLSGRHPPSRPLPSGAIGHGREHPVVLLVRRPAEG
jgi:hypothetical protein